MALAVDELLSAITQRDECPQAGWLTIFRTQPLDRGHRADSCCSGEGRRSVPREPRTKVEERENERGTCCLVFRKIESVRSC